MKTKSNCTTGVSENAKAGKTWQKPQMITMSIRATKSGQIVMHKENPQFSPPGSL